MKINKQKNRDNSFQAPLACKVIILPYFAWNYFIIRTG